MESQLHLVAGWKRRAHIHSTLEDFDVTFNVDIKTGPTDCTKTNQRYLQELRKYETRTKEAMSMLTALDAEALATLGSQRFREREAEKTAAAEALLTRETAFAATTAGKREETRASATMGDRSGCTEARGHLREHATREKRKCNVIDLTEDD